MTLEQLNWKNISDKKILIIIYIKKSLIYDDNKSMDVELICNQCVSTKTNYEGWTQWTLLPLGLNLFKLSPCIQ